MSTADQPLESRLIAAVGASQSHALLQALACRSGSLEPSHVLLSMGIFPATTQGSIRFNLSVYNTKEGMDAVIEIVPGIISRLRSISLL